MTDKTPTVTVTHVGPPRDRAGDVLADVETDSGYSLRITREGVCYNAILSRPDGRGGIQLHRWPSLPAVYESLAAYFLQWGEAHVWSALRASVDAETHQ
jgi:hypothetical protein